MPSGKAIVYFVSDLAYNLEGFVVNYNWKLCPNNCSNNGLCDNGYCNCNEGYTGTSCELPICTPNLANNFTICNSGVCANNSDTCICSGGYKGDYCQVEEKYSVWDTVHTVDTKKFTPRASHASVVVDNKTYIYGGFYFTEKSNQDLVVFNHDDKTFAQIIPKNDPTPPQSRYDHSMVYYKVRFFN